MLYNHMNSGLKIIDNQIKRRQASNKSWKDAKLYASCPLKPVYILKECKTDNVFVNNAQFCLQDTINTLVEEKLQIILY